MNENVSLLSVHCQVSSKRESVAPIQDVSEIHKKKGIRDVMNIVNKLYLEYQAESVFFQVNIIDLFKPTPIFLINSFKTNVFNTAKINNTFYKVPRQYLQKCVFLPLVDLHKVRIHVKTCRLYSRRENK